MNALIALSILSYVFDASASCPPGTLQGLTSGTCYDYSLASESWYDAEEKCQLRRGGHLASISSAFVNSFALDEVGSKFKADAFWIGASLGVTSANWSWTDGSRFRYAAWAKGQPSSSNGVQCALACENSTKWYSTSCDSYHAYICQFNSTSDGAPHQTCPQPAATRPSVTCPPVKPCPTCPPPPQKRCSPGWTYSNVTEKCYAIVGGSLEDARNQCGENYGELVSIHSDAENFWITDYLLNSRGPGVEAAFLGLYDKTGKCGWAWLDGTPVDYTNWGANQPFDCKGDGWNGTYVVANPDTWNKVGFRHWGQAYLTYGLVAPCVKAPN